MELLGDEGKWKLVSVHLEIVLVLVQDRCTVCARRTICSKMFRTQPALLLGDEGQVEARFGPFGDSVSVGARSVHGFRQTYRWLRNCFGRSRWYS